MPGGMRPIQIIFFLPCGVRTGGYQRACFLNTHLKILRIKKDFVHVPSGSHLKIFSEILRGVNNDGEGLSEITYLSGHTNKKFLTNNELLHLQDVADYIHMLKSFIKLVMVLLLCVVVTMIAGRVYPFSLSTVLWGLGAGIAGFILLLKKYGFVKVFYFIHDATFPSENKWFFLYEDSLMSTLLKAPDSFIPMGCILGFCTLVAFVIVYLLMSKLIFCFYKALKLLINPCDELPVLISDPFKPFMYQVPLIRMFF